MSRPHSYTQEKAEIFLKRLRGTEGNLKLAAKSLSLNTAKVQHWRQAFPEFDEQVLKVLMETKLK